MNFYFILFLIKHTTEWPTAYQFLVLYSSFLKSFWEQSIHQDLQAECRIRHSESLIQKIDIMPVINSVFFSVRLRKIIEVCSFPYQSGCQSSQTLKMKLGQESSKSQYWDLACAILIYQFSTEEAFTLYKHR